MERSIFSPYKGRGTEPIVNKFSHFSKKPLEDGSSEFDVLVGGGGEQSLAAGFLLDTEKGWNLAMLISVMTLPLTWTEF